MKLNIEKMAEEAGGTCLYGVPSDWDFGDYAISRKQLEALAHLIVERCAQAAEDAENNRESASMVIRNLMGG